MPPLVDKVTLFLATWQIRMVKDHLRIKAKKIDRVLISRIIDKRQWVMYMGPPEIYRNWHLYLTDEQIAVVKEKFKLKTAIAALNITKESLDAGDIAFK